MASHRPESLSTAAPGLGGLQIDAFGEIGEIGEMDAAMQLDTQHQLSPQDQSWPQAKTVSEQSIWVSLSNGEQLHMRQLFPCAQADDGRADVTDTDAIEVEANAACDLDALPLLGRSVFMLHGAAECGRIYYDDGGERGLAHFLARRGCEVFVIDLGGRGRSMVPGPGVDSRADVHNLVTEAIPALLAAAGKHSVIGAVEGPDVWVGHGFGAVLLAAAWARLPAEKRCARQWVLFAGRRRFSSTSRRAALFTRMFCHPLFARMVEWRKVLPVTRMGLGTVDENAAFYRQYANWMLSRDWCDVDGFDYGAALQKSPVPPTLHLATSADKVFCNLEDVRSFIDELGEHDARLVVVDRIGGEGARYSQLAMLLDPAAEQDLFAPLSDWLADAGQVAPTAMHYRSTERSVTISRKRDAAEPRGGVEPYYQAAVSGLEPVGGKAASGERRGAERSSAMLASIP